MVLAVALALAYRATTPRFELNDGLGYLDGVSYDAMTRAFRGEPDVVVQSPYVYRVAVPALVAASGAEVKRAFLALNVLALLGSALLLFALLRRYGARSRSGAAREGRSGGDEATEERSDYGATTRLALLGVLWWGALPAGLRYAFYYPVLLDGTGFLLLLALLHLALDRRAFLFGLLLPLAVLVRENLVALVPFLWLCELRGGFRSATLRAVLAMLPGIAALALVRTFPPIPPEKGLTLVEDVLRNLYWFAGNDFGRAWRYLAAGPVSLGLLFLVPFLAPRATGAFLRREPAWLYYLVATLLLSIVGGGDYDRFFLWLSPALLVLAFPVAARAGVWSGRLRPIALTALHLVAVRFLWPTGPDEPSYQAYNVATMDLQRLVALVVLAFALFVCAALVLRLAPRRA